jgi:hypothetical protein
MNHTIVHQLHGEFCKLTGQTLQLDYLRESMWMLWIQAGKTAECPAGHTIEDLRDMINELKRAIRAQERNPGALKFRNLIGNPDWFAEDIQELRARRKARRPEPGRDQAMRATGRVNAETREIHESRTSKDPSPAKSAREVTPQDFEALRKMLKDGR